MVENCTISLRICQEGHANALALNRDCTQIAVAGRSLLKVFSIENDGFTEVCNMRGGKTQNLSYSSNDVAWSSLDNNILATAATNGMISVWDLSKFGRHKQLLVYNEHERTAHTVTFHSTESNLLLSGSQDGTIKCFDLRVDKSISTYFSNSESVRDVAFSPQVTNTFAAVSENGTVQLWDIRRADKCSIQFTAHSGPIYTCDWHPSKNWLATGSRDKQIKVWNMDGKASLEHTIHTIAVVGRVKWRPDKINHIASCALVVDYSIHIWDIRRPYIPFACFNEHTNVTTGIAWKGNDSHVLLSTSKDSSIFKHAFKDAVRPALKATKQSACLNHKGDLLYAYQTKETQTTTSSTSSKSSFMIPRQKNQSDNEKFCAAESNLCYFTLKPMPMIDFLYTAAALKEDTKSNEFKDYESFIGCAHEYILTGKSVCDLCEHNAKIAKKYGKKSAANLWEFVRTLYGTTCANQKAESRSSLSNQNSITNRPQTTNPMDTSWSDDMNKDDQDDDVEDIRLLEFLSPKTGDLKGCLNTSAAGTDLMIFGKSHMSFENIKAWRDGFLYVGPHDLTKALSLPETAIHDLQAARPQQDIRTEHQQRQEPSPPPDPPFHLKINSNFPLICAQWEPHQVIANCFILQTDVGDVQTVSSILLAMGESRTNLPIEEHIYENWLISYIEQLHRHQLWVEATSVINAAWIRSVREMNQQSTSVHTSCGICGRALLGTAGWYCQKCRSADTSKCSVCCLVVKGHYAWCQGCGHGGHLKHMKAWFATRSKCPTCGHLCEYE